MGKEGQAGKTHILTDKYRNTSAKDPNTKVKLRNEGVSNGIMRHKTRCSAETCQNFGKGPEHNAP